MIDANYRKGKLCVSWYIEVYMPFKSCFCWDILEERLSNPIVTQLFQNAMAGFLYLMVDVR